MKKVMASLLLILIIAVPVYLAFTQPTGPDKAAESAAGCGNRFYKLVPDPAWALPKTGKPAPLVCQCS